MTRHIRHPTKGPSQAPTTTTLNIRTRLRPSHQDLVVIQQIGIYLSHLEGVDLARRCKAGLGHTKDDWAERKRLLTSECSSRWAGSITKTNNNAYKLARRNQERHKNDLAKSIKTITNKLALPIRDQAERKKQLAAERILARQQNRTPSKIVFGYRSPHEHAMKRQRLEHLKAERATLVSDIASGRVRIVRGGARLLKNRLHLDIKGVSQEGWVEQWAAKRCEISVNGECGKRYGNETIRVYPDGALEVDLPAPLAHLANITHRKTTRYRFDAKAVFVYRYEDWLAQVLADRAVAYTIQVDPTKGRIYLEADFTPIVIVAVPTLEELLADSTSRVLAVDLNHGFVAPQIIDRDGNPIGHLPHVPFVAEGLPATTRDGHLRQTISTLIVLAKQHGCRAIVVEDLGFEDMRVTGREVYGSRRWFRKVVGDMPTATFRVRLVAMAGRQGLAVVGVPAAYSSIWGAEHWQKPMSTPNYKVSRHSAAAVVLGRRAFGFSARRRTRVVSDVTISDQRIEEAGFCLADMESYHASETGLAGLSDREEPVDVQRLGGVHESGVRLSGVLDGFVGSRPGKTVCSGRAETSAPL